MGWRYLCCVWRGLDCLARPWFILAACSICLARYAFSDWRFHSFRASKPSFDVFHLHKIQQATNSGALKCFVRLGVSITTLRSEKVQRKDNDNMQTNDILINIWFELLWKIIGEKKLYLWLDLQKLAFYLFGIWLNLSCNEISKGVFTLKGKTYVAPLILLIQNSESKNDFQDLKVKMISEWKINK